MTAQRTAPTAAPVAGVRNFLGKWGLLLVLLVLWELATRAAGNVYFLPPTEIVAHAWQIWLTGPASRLWLTDAVFRDVLPSLGRLFGGWLISGAIGVVLGIALGRSRKAAEYVGPLLDFFRSLPTPALVPLFLVLFNLGTPMQLATIVFGTVFTVVLNTADGAASVDSVKEQTALAFRISRWDWWTRIVLPAAAPKIFAGLRVSLSQALILMVVSEMVGASSGLGFQLVYAQQQFEFPDLWAGIVLLALLGYLLNTGLLAVQRRALSWQQRSDQPAQAKG
ncbi:MULTISPECIES: ABC transporter permease [unclassified Saccharopolyspora]|uniref:ABC transporter permease n=1 Tax=unclassified Saccharopolyspora TaxID=2646250 RepID=UPI001CD1EC38|nr:MULTISPECIES: ABC transporter permease [unclassified Saccharopolyspora]MCA1193537.1 ABC transporter permease [Saccharopolyspora sp. 6V]MCA1280098.1 ABC transporter permease [Saccharopolyspora sp. 7B]